MSLGLKRPGERFAGINQVVGYLLLVCAGTTIAIAQESASDWPMWRANAQRSAFITQPLPGKLYPLWTRELGEPIPAWPASQHKLRFDVSYEPVIAGKRLFVSSMVNDSLTAYNTDSGAELWRFYTDAPLRFAPVVWRDLVIVTSDDGNVYALDTASGKLRWQKQCAPRQRWLLGNYRLISVWPMRGAPVLYKEKDGSGTLYLAAGIWPFMGTFIYALNATTGEERWVNSGSGATYTIQQHNSPAFAGVAPQGYMAVNDDILLVSGGRTVPAAYNRHTGALVHFEVAARAFGKDAGGYDLSISEGMFINNGCLYSLSDGEPVANLLRKTAFVDSCPRIIDNDIVAASYNGIVLFDKKPEVIKTEKVNPRGVKYFSYDFQIPPPVLHVEGLPASQVHFRSGNQLFLSGPGGWIGAIDLTKGNKQSAFWETRLDDKSEIWQLIPGDNKLFAITESGNIHAFGAISPPTPKKYQLKIHPSVAQVPLAGPGGYAMVWGLSKPDTVENLLKIADRFHVIGIDPNPETISKLRYHFSEIGVYGRRIHLLAGDPTRMELPQYSANLIEILLTPDQAESALNHAWGLLRPYGGVAVFRGVQAQTTKPTLPERLKTILKPQNHYFDTLVSSVDKLKTKGAVVKASKASEMLVIRRPGSLPNSAPWTHENADPANSVLSQDELVKPPLGLLWFGGPPNDDILPRHGHGPAPQIAGGRLLIEGPNALRAMDVYSGRLLWQRAFPGLGAFYDNTAHQPGANEIGSNYVTLEDAIYVVYQSRCYRLDPITGDTVSTFVLPSVKQGEAPPNWGYLGVYKDLLIGSAAPTAIKIDETKNKVDIQEDVPYSSSSARLVVMDRHTGKVLWQRQAGLLFRHNAVIAANNRIFCVDGLPEITVEAMKRHGKAPEKTPVLYALDAMTGKVLWHSDNNIFGTWLGYSYQHDILLEGGSYGGDRARDEARNKIATYRGTTGEIIWEKSFSYSGRPILHDETIYTERNAFSLLTGEQWSRPHPITEEDMQSGFARNYGCNTPVGGRHLLCFRSAAAGFYDISTQGGTGNWGGFKSGCTSNLIPADGVLNAPDYTRTCTCSYQNQCSLALVSMPDVEVWTFQSFSDFKAPAKNLAINFGAPGDWPEPDGALWFEYPMVGGPGPKIKIDIQGDPTYYCRHSLDITGEATQVTASGIKGSVKIKIPLQSEEKHRYNVKLLFAEPKNLQVGQRIFDVYVQGKLVLPKLDITKAAGGKLRSFTHLLKDVTAQADLEINLKPVQNSQHPPLLCGVHIVRDEETKLAAIR